MARFRRERAGRLGQDAQEPPSAGGKNRHCSSPVLPDVQTARKQAESDEADDGLTPKLSRAEGVGLND
jgi:hypothetical protein